METDYRLHGLKLAMLLLVVLASSVFAANSNYMHTRDSYYAVFDGEGDAITYAKITVRNNGPLAMGDVWLTIPGIARVYEVMQQGGQVYGTVPECPPYVTECYNPPTKYDGSALKRLKYETGYDEWGNTKLHLRLDSLVQVDRETTIVIFYKARGYAQKDVAGVYNFNFKSIVDSDTMLAQQVAVTASVQPELSLAGVESHTDFRMNEVMMGAAKATSSESRAEAMQSIAQTMESGVQRFGGITKTGYNIDPGESFVVGGYFADAWWKLYIVPAIAAVILAATAFLLAGKFAAHAIGKEKRGALAESVGYGIASALGVVFFVVVAFISASISQNSYSPLAIPAFLVLIGSGFLALVSLFVGAALAWRRHGVKHGALALGVTLVLVVLVVVAIVALLTPKPVPIRMY